MHPAPRPLPLQAELVQADVLLPGGAAVEVVEAQRPAGEAGVEVGGVRGGGGGQEEEEEVSDDCLQQRSPFA